MNNLNTAFQSLPVSVREWLADENVALAVDEINQKLNLSEENSLDYVIPHLVLRLCVQDLEPRDFINELSHWLNISFDSAKHLTQEIEEKILKPIEAPLKIDVGIDLKLLYFASAVTRIKNPAPEERGSPNKIGRRDDNKNIPIVIASPASLSTESGAGRSNLPSEAPRTTSSPSINIIAPRNNTSTQPNPKPETPNKPFILHEEKEFHPSAGSGSSFRYKPSMDSRASQPTATPKAQIQVPPLQPPPIIKRVVHYNRFLTPVILKSPTATEGSLEILRPSTSSGTQNDTSKVKLPRSRWFV